MIFVIRTPPCCCATAGRIRTVSERLGHASVTITQTVHGQVMPGVQKRAADRFATLIAEA